jgi:hypothetical protein
MLNLFMLTAIAGFAIGHFKMRYGGWMPYIVIEGLVLMLVLATIAKASRDRTLARRIPVTRVYLVLCVYSLTAVVRPDVPLFSGLMGYRALLMCPALLFAGYLAFDNPRQLQKVYFLLASLGAVTAVIGLYQWSVGPDVVATWGGHYPEFARKMLWTRLSQDKFVFRAFSTFVQPGVFGAAMACVMLTVLAQIISGRVKAIYRVLLVIAFAVMGAGVIVSASRLSMVNVALGAIAMVGLKGGTGEKAKRLIQASVILGATLWIALQFTGPAFVERLQSVGTPQSFFFRWFVVLL